MDESRNADVETADWGETQEPESAEENGKTGEEIVETMLRLLHRYWKKRRLALSIVAAGCAISIAYSLMLRNYYVSTTSLMPQDNSSPYSSMLGMLSGSGAAASLGSEALGLSTPGELQTSILESRTVRDAMIQKYDLMHYYNVRLAEDARWNLSSATKIEQDRKSGIITISVTDKSPEFACKLAQGYVTELNSVLTLNSTSAARRERVFLEERLKSVKRDLDDSSIALSQFSTKNKAVDIPSQARVMLEASFRLKSMLAEGESQLAALKQTYSEDNYRVKAAEARNAELQRQYNALGDVTKTAGTGTQANTTYPSVGDLPKLGLTYFDLERTLRVDEAIWETLTKQYEMARVQEAKEIPSITVLDVANIPVHKSGPRRTIIVLAITFFSFVLSCLVIFALTSWEEMDEEALPKKLHARLFRKTQVSQSSNELTTK
jgi:uncharacterized protein involved in exopolysaccharide biosynthesis